MNMAFLWRATDKLQNAVCDCNISLYVLQPTEPSYYVRMDISLHVAFVSMK